LANLVNEAALNAARMNQKTVNQEDFESAKDKVLMGVARKSLIISEHEKRVTAYHEAGHALVAVMVEGADPLHKVTIIPRGMALGLTQQLPVDDRHTYPRLYLEGQLAIMMGGRLAEELFLDTMTTGAGNDIEQATELARKMVCQFGMSSLGPMTFGKQEEQIFLGREIAQHRDYSEHTAVSIDEEVRRFVMQGYNRAKTILTEHREGLIRIAEALLERESLDAAEIKMLLNGQPLEERRTPKVEPRNEKPTPAPAKVIRPTIPPHEKPAPA
jgi:cell division protease FtsH